MFVKTLKSLVLRDVSVRLDGTVASARLGFGYVAESQPREVPFFSMRHAGGEIVAEPQGDRVRGHNLPADNPSLRAGRSVRLAGVLHRRTSTTTVVDGTPGPISPLDFFQIFREPFSASRVWRVHNCP